jgi:hypothetical protein
MLVYFYETTRRHIPEDLSFHTRRRDNLKSHMFMLKWCKSTIARKEQTLTGRFPLQGILPIVEMIHSFRSNSEMEQVTRPNPYS